MGFLFRNQGLVSNGEPYFLFGNSASAKNFINSCCRLEEVCPQRSFILVQYCPHKFSLTNIALTNFHLAIKPSTFLGTVRQNFIFAFFSLQFFIFNVSSETEFTFYLFFFSFPLCWFVIVTIQGDLWMVLDWLKEQKQPARLIIRFVIT